MFEATNLSNNPLTLSDGKALAPGEMRKIRTIGDRENKYRSHGWLQILEEKKEKEEVKTK